MPTNPRGTPVSIFSELCLQCLQERQACYLGTWVSTPVLAMWRKCSQPLNHLSSSSPLPFCSPSWCGNYYTALDVLQLQLLLPGYRKQGYVCHTWVCCIYISSWTQTSPPMNPTSSRYLGIFDSHIMSKTWLYNSTCFSLMTSICSNWYPQNTMHRISIAEKQTGKPPCLNQLGRSRQAKLEI